jgi:hypothetical protein
MGQILAGSDARTDTDRPHRLLAEPPGGRPNTIEFLRAALAKHHAEPEKRARAERQNEALARQGLAPLPLYPTNASTRKGNLAEVALAEYVVAAGGVSLPVYRLRYNPNVDQSMKGDDVLAFDLDSTPMRVLVGESKFRGTPRREHVEEIVNGLMRSHRAKIPVSLQFVVDILYREGKPDLGRRLMECQLAIARGDVKIEYVGLLLGSTAAARCVTKHTPGGEPKRLAMISLGVDGPEALVEQCFDALK